MISRETFQIQHRELNGQLGRLQISCLSSAAQVSFWEVKILYFSGTSFIFIFCIIGLQQKKGEQILLMHLIVMLRKLLFAIIQSFFILGSIKIFSNKKIWVKLLKYLK